MNAHRLIFYQPGHFHAALTLRQANPRVARDVHVYATEGQELDAFVALVEAFNQRDEAPTDWHLHVHAGPEPLSRLIAESPGDIVVLAGRNDGKLAAIRDLHAAGLSVLADKPWITDDSGADALRSVTAGAPLAMDIMTERHDTVALLRKAVLGQGALLGPPRRGDEAAFEIGSTHHLYKVVNGQPLRRPPWYYDVRVQGDGLVDIQTHMTDQAQWLFEPHLPPGADGYDLDRDFELISARRWTTTVPPELFADSTGVDPFPQELSQQVGPDGLALACNGEMDYRLCGYRVRQTAIWEQREPVGSGDLHYSTVRGELATMTVSHNALAGHRPDIRITPQSTPASTDGFVEHLRASVAELNRAFPGIGWEGDDAAGYRLELPAALRTSHESHFALVLEAFLDHVEAGQWPASLPAAIRARHGWLARAWAAAHAMNDD